MALVAVQIVQCDTCRGMMMATGDSSDVTSDIREATTYRTTSEAATAANMRGWRIWTGWRDNGDEYVSRVDCPSHKTP